MKVQKDVRSLRHKDPGIGWTVVFESQSRQVAEFIAAADDGAAWPPFFFSATYGASDDDTFSWLGVSITGFRHTLVVSRHFHPFVKVVRCLRIMAREIEAKMMGDGWRARQDFNRS